MFTTENAEISDDFWKRRTQLYFSYYKRAFFIKALNYRRFGNDIVQSVSVFPRRASMVIFLQSKSFVRRRLRRCRLRHKNHAIKTRSNNPLRFLQHKNSIRRYLANDLTCAARKTTFRTRKRFHNKQYTSKSKVQPHGSDRTHFYVRFNKSNVATHRPTIIFLLSHKITTVQQKTTNRNNQSHKQSDKTIQNLSINNKLKTKHNKHEQLSHQLTVKSITKTTTTNNPHNLSIKNALKTNHYNKHNNPSPYTKIF